MQTSSNQRLKLEALLAKQSKFAFLGFFISAFVFACFWSELSKLKSEFATQREIISALLSNQ